MSKYFMVGLMVMMLIGCTTQTVPKKPPLVPYNQKAWIAVNAGDFIPPKAKTYIRLKEIDLVQDEQKTQQGEQEEE